MRDLQLHLGRCLDEVEAGDRNALEGRSLITAAQRAASENERRLIQAALPE